MKLKHKSDSAHWYDSEGNPHHDADLRKARSMGLLYSVTTALQMWPKGGLDDWKQSQAIEITIDKWTGKQPEDSVAVVAQRVVEQMEANLEAAAEWGRTIHNMFETYAKDSLFPKVPDEFLPWCEPIEQWFSQHVTKVIFAERRLVNNECGYAGTCDLGVETKHWGFALCDFKRRGFSTRGGNYYPTDAMQMEAYARCLPDGRRPDSIVSVAVNRDVPEVESMLWPNEKRETYWKQYLACYELLCMVKNYRPPVQFALPMPQAPTSPANPTALPSVKRKRAKRFKAPSTPEKPATAHPEAQDDPVALFTSTTATE